MKDVIGHEAFGVRLLPLSRRPRRFGCVRCDKPLASAGGVPPSPTPWSAARGGRGQLALPGSSVVSTCLQTLVWTRALFSSDTNPGAPLLGHMAKSRDQKPPARFHGCGSSQPQQPPCQAGLASPGLSVGGSLFPRKQRSSRLPSLR